MSWDIFRSTASCFSIVDSDKALLHFRTFLRQSLEKKKKEKEFKN